MIVLLTGTWVFSLTSAKKGGNNPSLAIAINILGCQKITSHKFKYVSHL
jgi:hypothetical protein